AHLLGKCWRDGMGVLPDDEQAELWFRRAAKAGHDFSQYALGKLLQSQKRMEEAVSWYEKAVAQGSPYAAYRLGKLYLEGTDVPKDVTKAVEYLSDAAQEGNQYAQYTLGKLYLTGEDVARNREQAYRWFWESASQGNEYAQFFLKHFHDNHSPNVLLSATKLLHHLGQIFQDNSVPPAAPAGHGVDRKLLRKIRAKKIVMGHKPGDHEDLELTQGGMGGMTGY
ncbi:tetratricopeptide repeat protein, partial [Dysosmobacter welbionis]|uniref:tetratricopeptide repeat protein n=1 Tax=Dysosmobacter welbionis TaxID=2093857 RepID=UPI003078D3F8